MATVITSECINCGACEPECPNTAIYQGGVDWELDGVTHPAISQDIFYIVPEKCTECVGFHDHEACAAVCPVDCCVPDPAIPEAEDVLMARARVLHPEKAFEADFPSRFKKEGGAVPAVPTEAGATPGPAVAAPAPKAAAPVAVMGRVEKPLSPPRVKAAPVAPMKEKAFPGELPGSFESALARLGNSRRGGSTAVKWLVALTQPLLGALPYSQKKRLEEYIGDPRFFTAAGATGVNALHNMVLYPALLVAVGALWMGKEVFSNQLGWYITFGVTLAMLEAMVRMREGLKALPQDQVIYRASVYGEALGIVFKPLTRILTGPVQRGTVAVEGFSGGTFADKLERERRYGEVYSLEDKGNGYLLRFEFPRRVPPSGMKEELGVPDDMPPYDYELALQSGALLVKGSVTDPKVRKVASVSQAFPPDFTTPVALPEPVSGFRHRIRDRVLEVVLLKR
jgi:ferredoxin